MYSNLLERLSEHFSFVDSLGHLASNGSGSRWRQSENQKQAAWSSVREALCHDIGGVEVSGYIHIGLVHCSVPGQLGPGSVLSSYKATKFHQRLHSNPQSRGSFLQYSITLHCHFPPVRDETTCDCPVVSATESEGGNQTSQPCSSDSLVQKQRDCMVISI